jgi:signal recognition particle subunit SEC65
MMDPEKKKWSVLYPVYINSKKTAADGRKIAKTKACENPTAQEIFDVCKHLGFKCELEVPDLPPPHVTTIHHTIVVHPVERDRPRLNLSDCGPGRQSVSARLLAEGPGTSLDQGEQAGRPPRHPQQCVFSSFSLLSFGKPAGVLTPQNSSLMLDA